MRYHLFQKFFGKMVKIKKTSYLSTREDTNFLPPLYNFLSYMANGCSLIQVCPISQRRYILFPELFATTCRIGQKDVA